MVKATNPYIDESFANNWNKLQKTKDVYKNKVLLPKMFEIARVSELEIKRVCELGCGNGNLASLLLETNIDYLCAIDISKFNLYNTIKNNKNDSRLNLIELDLTQNFRENKKLKELDLGCSFDLVVSNMVINEMEDLNNFFEFASSLLRKNGRLIVSTLSDKYLTYLNYPKVFSFEVEGLGVSVPNYCRSGVKIRSFGEKQKLNFLERLDIQIDDSFLKNNQKFEFSKSIPLISIYIWTK